MEKWIKNPEFLKPQPMTTLAEPDCGCTILPCKPKNVLTAFWLCEAKFHSTRMLWNSITSWLWHHKIWNTMDQQWPNIRPTSQTLARWLLIVSCFVFAFIEAGNADAIVSFKWMEVCLPLNIFLSNRYYDKDSQLHIWRIAVSTVLCQDSSTTSKCVNRAVRIKLRFN